MQLSIATTQQPTAKQVLLSKANAYRKVSDKYQLRTDAIEHAIERLKVLAESRGIELHSTGIKATSRRATKSTKYRIECRLGTGDLVPTIVFRDSMNGESCTFIDFGIYRKVCSNGLHIATSEQLVFKQNHLNQWQLDDAQIVAIFEQAFAAMNTLMVRYSNIQVSQANVVNMRNQLLQRLATNGIITESQAGTAQKYYMSYYDRKGDLFGVVNAVQESLTTNRNGLKKQTMANERLNMQLLPAIEQALAEVYSIQLAA